VPESWPGVLAEVAEMVQSRHMGLLSLDGDRRASVITTAAYRQVGELYAGNTERYDNPRPRRALASGHAGFITDLELSTRAELDRDLIYRELISPAGLRHTAGSVIAVPTADILVFDIARND